MRSNPCRSSTTSIYMLTDFDPKRTISEVRVHDCATFGHTGCWSITKRRFSTKLSKSFDHHGKTKKEIVQKKKLRKMKKKTWTSLEICEKIDEYVIDYACEDASVKVAKVKSVKTWWLNVRQGDAPKLVPTRTHCEYRLCRSGEGHLIVVCGAPRPTAWLGNNFSPPPSLPPCCTHIMTHPGF